MVRITDCLFFCISIPTPFGSHHLSFFESLVFVEVLLLLVVFLYLEPEFAFLTLSFLRITSVRLFALTRE